MREGEKHVPGDGWQCACFDENSVAEMVLVKQHSCRLALIPWNI